MQGLRLGGEDRIKVFIGSDMKKGHPTNEDIADVQMDGFYNIHHHQYLEITEDGS